MVPSGFVVLPEFPVTANGKLDTRAFPVPEAQHKDASEVVDPQTPMEETLLQAWKNVLGIEQISTHDNFFELGGHSLMVLRLISAINRSCSRHVKVADLFSHPTIADLADHISRSLANEENSPHLTYLESIRTGRRQTHLVIIGATLRPPLKDLPPEVPVWWLKLDGLHVVPHLDLDVSAQAAAHVDEIRESIPSGTILLCGHSYGGLLAFEIANQLRHSPNYVPILIMIEPSAVWKPRDSYVKRIADQVRAVCTADAIGNTQQLLGRIKNKIKFKLLQTHQKKLENPVIGQNPDADWRQARPYFMRNIRKYRCFSEPLSCDVH